MSNSRPQEPRDPGTPWDPAEAEPADPSTEERVRRRLTRIMLVLVVLVLAVLGAEIAYFIGVERRTPPAPTGTDDAYSGWQSVGDNDSHARYQVPPEFVVEDGLQRRSLGQQVPDGADYLSLRSTATLPDAGCAQNPEAVTALTGFVDHPSGSDLPPVEQVVREAATQSLSPPDGAPVPLPEPTSRELPLVDGGTARIAVLDVPVTEAYPCSPPALRFTVVQYELRGRPVQFLLAGDVGDARELPGNVEHRILTSLGAAE